MKRFINQVAIITGGADGLGKGIALQIASEGCQVILFDRNLDLLNSTVNEFRAAGLLVGGYVVDVSVESEIADALQNVESIFGKIDILVHAAGIVGPTNTKIADYNTDDFDQVYRVNLRGSFLMTKYVVRIMEKANYGRILLIASIAGKDGNPGMVGYSSTKAGVIGLVKGVGKEYAESGITVNGLAPAVIRTAMNEQTDPVQLEYMTSKIPMKRLGTVQEVAEISSWIISPQASFTTGFTFDLSGGRATY